MKFRVGPWIYRVRISTPDKPLEDEVGLPAASLCSWSERMIWLAANLPAEQRLDALFYELARLWQQHFGLPSDDNGRANLISSFAVDVWRQLEFQGGGRALILLGPNGIVDAASAPTIDLEQAPTRSTYAVQCGSCQGLIAIGDVIDGRARYDGKHRRMVLDRCACCECGSRQSWVEAANTMGKPTGLILDQPVLGRSP